MAIKSIRPGPLEVALVVFLNLAVDAFLIIKFL